MLTSWYVFDKYYKLSDESPAYAAALILHPSRREAYIQKNWPKSWQKKVFNSVKKLREDDYKGLTTIDSTPSLVPDAQPDEYDLAQELDVRGTVSSVNEYEAYTSQTPIVIECSPLTRWLRDEQQERYPRLSKMAIDILSIPAMSADPERVFFWCATYDLMGTDVSWSRYNQYGGVPKELNPQRHHRRLAS